MTRIKSMQNAARCRPALFLLLPFFLLAGCSPDIASVDDVYVPESASARFPITVAERPVKLSVSAASGKLSPQDVNRTVAFAREAQANASSPVTIAYPSGSSNARTVARQTAQLLAAQGVPRGMIEHHSYAGTTDVVSLSFGRTVAMTKPCGNWSQDLRGNQLNESYPDFGCSVQNNFAAMAANPEDFERQQPGTSNYYWARRSAMRSYSTGQQLRQRTFQSFFDF